MSNLTSIAGSNVAAEGRGALGGSLGASAAERWRQDAFAPKSSARDDRSIVLLPAVWASLERGHATIVDHFFSERRCYAVLRNAPEEAGVQRGLSPAQRALLRRIILGHQQKALAIELGISCTAVTLRVRRAIRRLGFDCRPADLPLFALMAALSFHGRIPGIAQARLVEGEGVRVYSIPRIDARLPKVLSQAECEVTRLLVEGHHQADIAARRGTAARTVANQTGSVFAKLGVCGRLDLMRFLAISATARARPLT